MVKKFEKAFADYYQIDFARTVTSGTAAVHTALASVNPDQGDEIITT